MMINQLINIIAFIKLSQSVVVSKNASSQIRCILGNAQVEAICCTFKLWPPLGTITSLASGAMPPNSIAELVLGPGMGSSVGLPQKSPAQCVPCPNLSVISPPTRFAARTYFF